MAHPGRSSATPTTLTQATACHPRRYRCPSGNNKNVKTSAGPAAIQWHRAIHSANGPAGQPSSAARSPQPCARSAANPLRSAVAQNSQPIRWPGCRDTMSAPAPASVTA